MSKKGVFCLVCAIVLRVTALAVPLDTVAINQLAKLQQKEKRPVLVIIGTEWCKYCSAMEASLKKKELTKILHDQYYFVKIDGEERKALKFNDRMFYYRPTGASTGIHDLAAYFATDEKGSLSFPTVCILNGKNEIVFRYNGFLRGKELYKLLINFLPPK